ncbi:GNAT family N-acetyltransferase [Nocardia wallacei]|uniref:GNAT family N-acetyltransferase n=1 Tax=Nocardia wallacei TaxID=480035 RepID=UPI0024537DD8|nr:GNAT family N-acetyltransferase [Nocardia wallacei]
MNQASTPYVLPRELTDIPDAVRQAPAPPVPEFHAPYSLRVIDADGDDPATVAAWMSRPHLVRTWDQPWPVDRWRQHLRAQLEGGYTRPCILSVDGREAAYIEIYRVAKDECGRLYDADPHDLGFHIATGELELTGRGVMSRWIARLPSALFAADPRCRRVLGDPEYSNRAIRRAFEKSDWTCVGEFDVRPDRRIALYAAPRTPGDLPVTRG